MPNTKTTPKKPHKITFCNHELIIEDFFRALADYDNAEIVLQYFKSIKDSASNDPNELLIQAGQRKMLQELINELRKYKAKQKQ